MTLSYPNMFSIENRTAVITGGTRGIGAAMAVALAEAGADIILVQVGQRHLISRGVELLFSMPTN